MVHRAGFYTREQLLIATQGARTTRCAGNCVIGSATSGAHRIALLSSRLLRR
jgi:hypothetical protein